MISVEEFVERLCLLGAARGPRRFPRRRRDRDILLRATITAYRDHQARSETRRRAEEGRRAEPQCGD